MKYPKLLTVHCPQDLTSASMGQSSCRYVSLRCDWPGQSAHITFIQPLSVRTRIMPLSFVHAVPSTSPPRSALAFLAVCIAPFPKSIFALTRVGARFMGGNLVSVSDPPFHIFSFLQSTRVKKTSKPNQCNWFLCISTLNIHKAVNRLSIGSVLSQ